jgi:hypothetical protein
MAGQKLSKMARFFLYKKELFTRVRIPKFTVHGIEPIMKNSL